MGHCLTHKMCNNKLWCLRGKPGRGHTSFLLHYLLMAMVKLDTKEVTTGEIMVATIKVAREVAGYKELKDEGTIRDKDLK